MNHQAMARLCRPEGGYDVADKPVFYYGTAWYPEWEPEGEWRSDLDNMKRAGLNTVRIAEFSWEHLEPRPGEFHFELYDQVMARCEELGIWVVLGIDSVRPPVWLFEQYPDIHLVDQAGRPAPGSWPMHCFNHPGFLKTSARFIERVVNRYKGSPALVYYQLDNEPAYHARGSHRDRATCYCYCAHCQRAFRTWLSRRYPEQGMLRVPSPLPEPEVMGELLWLGES
jgi:beta-galactosidase